MNQRHAYYNDNDPFIADYLRILIKEGLIADGEVDQRPIQEVEAKDLKPFRQVHLFAGIGAWSLALWLARWPDERPVWSCSCPCPPFSTAGKQKSCPECQGSSLIACPARTGFFICCSCAHAWNADPRHLLPEVWRLIRDTRPDCPIFGEQVASETGRDWLAMLRSSVEILAYDTWGADICSAGVGKDHIRQRLGWVAYAEGDHGRRKLQEEREERGRGRSSGSGIAGGMGNADGRGEFRQSGKEGAASGKSKSKMGEQDRERIWLQSSGASGGPERLADPTNRQLQKQERGSKGGDGLGPIGKEPAAARRLGHTDRPGLEGWGRIADQYPDQWYIRAASIPILCGDGKWRRVPANQKGEPEPALFPLADAGDFRNRVGTLRSAGNTIDSALFAQFILAAQEAIGF